jgi:putative spermidine/putrescine transport system ATP-binding protein
MVEAPHGVSLRGMRKRFGPVVAVDGVDLDLPAGRLIAFLGPSGCGKTTLLRLIAGLETPSEGRVLIDGEDVTGVPTHRRGVGMVFQSLALFPHLSVGGNIAYGLRIRGIDRERQRRRVEELLDLVRLPGVADRHVAALSGGQRQRVAIARALALEPRLFLLDEPLSALDAKLREDMQVEIRLLQQRLGITTIVVTHDQREAMTMSDLVVVMGHGTVQQVAPPLVVYRSPVNAFVAGFIGSTNLLPATVAGPGRLACLGREIAVAALPEGIGPGEAVVLSVRPEDVALHAASAAPANGIAGRVTFIRDVGASVETHLECDGAVLVSVASPKDRPAAALGDTVIAVLPAAASVVVRP